MIITLIFIGVILLGIIGCIDYHHDVFSYDISDVIIVISGMSIVIGGIALLISLIGIGIEHCNVDKRIYDSCLERESIISQIECVNSDYEDVSKAAVIQRVYEWNQGVHNAEYWSSNQWTSWFWSKDYVESLEYIDLELLECK